MRFVVVMLLALAAPAHAKDATLVKLRDGEAKTSATKPASKAAPAKKPTTKPAPKKSAKRPVAHKATRKVVAKPKHDDDAKPKDDVRPMP